MDLTQFAIWRVTIICALVGPLIAAEEAFVQSNWKPCGGGFLSPPTAENIQVSVPMCLPANGTETCALQKGTMAEMIIKFKATESVEGLERIISARVPAAFDRKVEMPYGPAISPCDNSSMVATEGGECMNGGVEANKSYTYTSTFDVLKSFPTVKDVETRIILRKRIEKHNKIRLYRKHPGPTVFCVLIPNIEVVE